MGKYRVFLSERLPWIPYEEGYSLAAHTSVAIGGRTDAFFPRTAQEAEELFSLCLAEGIPVFPLGAGSNVLAPDAGYRGVVLSSAKLQSVSAQGERVIVQSGVSVGKLLSFCAEKELAGAEFLAGIPATVGGLVFMNGGTEKGHIGDLVESVVFTDRQGVRTLAEKDCLFSYKDSYFQHRPAFILSAVLRLKRGEREKIRALSAQVAAERRRLPVGKSMGCVFKNPKGVSAGKLIEECGGKGLRVGGAFVSDQHANFILNDGGATEKDFCTLIALVKKTVYQKAGITLEEEIRYMQ